MVRVGILYHPMIEAAYILARELESFLVSKGVSAWLCSAWEEEKARGLVDSTDLILTIGGDGTILRAAQVALPAQIPITGINLGRLGFMTELSTDEAREQLPALLAGNGWIDERFTLEVQFSSVEGPRTYNALNDVVLARGAITRLVRVEAIVDGEPLTTFKADGVIVATATGSTGYSLAAGGPILHPQANEFILLPVSPHLSLAYPMVLPATAEVGLRISTPHPATLSVDGHINLQVISGMMIAVRHSAHKVRFLRIHQPAFYSSLERRLKGKQ